MKTRRAAEYYIRVDTFYANSPDTYFGPYASRREAEAAIAEAKKTCNMVSRGESPADIFHAVRVLGVYPRTVARRLGMREYENVVPASAGLPRDIEDLSAKKREYTW